MPNSTCMPARLGNGASAETRGARATVVPKRPGLVAATRSAKWKDRGRNEISPTSAKITQRASTARKYTNTVRAVCPLGADVTQRSTPAHASGKDFQELHVEHHGGRQQPQHGAGEAREVAVPMEQEAPVEPPECVRIGKTHFLANLMPWGWIS